MARPTKSLLEHVRDNTWRRDRHEDLLAGELLPEQPPAWADPHIWMKLREVQEQFQQADNAGSRDLAFYTDAFSKILRRLHGGRNTVYLGDA